MANSVTNAQFRADFSEFASTTTFLDSDVTYWLTLAELLLNSTIGGARWSTLLVVGEELFAAHNLVLEAMNRKVVVVGGLPGINKGVISSETPGEVSLSYDTTAGSILNAGHWNLTTYGTRFLSLARMIGSGGIQVGVCDPPGIGCGWGSGFGSGQGWL